MNIPPHGPELRFQNLCCTLLEELSKVVKGAPKRSGDVMELLLDAVFDRLNMFPDVNVLQLLLKLGFL